MGTKDVTEKILEDYNDVFADIANVLLFQGKERIKPNDLRNSSVHSMYKADDTKVHEQERDVAKIWMPYNIKLALIGYENQTEVYKFMPFRAIGYDGANYRKKKKKENDTIIPVVTIVLYFGSKHWNVPKNLKSFVNIPIGLEEYVNDYKIHVFEIAWLSEETISKFKSDFGVVARFFANKRKNPEYVPDDKTKIRHVDEVLKLLSVIAKDHRYEDVLKSDDFKEVQNMCDVAERIERKGIKQGIEQGQDLLIEAARRLRNGESPEQLWEKDFDKETIAKAQQMLSILK